MICYDNSVNDSTIPLKSHSRPDKFPESEAEFRELPGTRCPRSIERLSPSRKAQPVVGGLYCYPRLGPLGLGDDQNQEVLPRVEFLFKNGTRRDKMRHKHMRNTCIGARNLRICCQIGGRQVDVKRAVCCRQSCGRQSNQKDSQKTHHLHSSIISPNIYHELA